MPENGGGHGMVACFAGRREGNVVAALADGGLIEIEEREPSRKQCRLGQRGRNGCPRSASGAAHQGDAELCVGVDRLEERSRRTGPVQRPMVARDLDVGVGRGLYAIAGRFVDAAQRKQGRDARQGGESEQPAKHGRTVHAALGGRQVE
jgi:hypothetical protein